MLSSSFYLAWEDRHAMLSVRDDMPVRAYDGSSDTGEKIDYTNALLSTNAFPVRPHSCSDGLSIGKTITLSNTIQSRAT